VVAVACTDYESDSTSPPDAGGDGGSGGAGDASSPDTSNGLVTPVSPCATKGQRIAPVRAYDATQENTLGLTCNPGAVLVVDGKSAGLDRSFGEASGLEPGKIGDQQVLGCVAVDFAVPVKLASLAITAGPTGNACGTGCNENDPTEGCKTGHTMHVFIGPSRDAVKLVATPELAATITERIVPVEGELTTVIVCRASWGPRRDDVAVDAIEGICP